MIPVTKPFLPPQSEYEKYLNDVWRRNWLTNNGPLVNELELKLKEYFSLDHMLYLANGTIALQIAIKTLELKGEILTTPFSYVATTSCIVWEGCRPVFVDIDPATLNMDPQKIERSITSDTSAILATHVYGNSCDVEAIDLIARKHRLKVIYDAAHCFGTQFKGRSILEYGDISTISFHATKLFHTIEGGAVITKDPALLRKMAYLRNFGHIGDDYSYIGVNAKNSEFHAAMGLVNLRYIDQVIARRRELTLYYNDKLKLLRHRVPRIQENCNYNCAYYTVILESEEFLLRAVELLNENRIYPRRYFYPSLSSMNYVEKQSTPVSDDISSRVLSLPLFDDLRKEEIDLIARLLLRVQNYG